MTAVVEHFGPSCAEAPPVSTQRRVRVLFLVDYARLVGGAERFATGLAAHMPRDRVEPWVCSTRHGMDDAVRMLAEAGVRHVELERTRTWQVHRFTPLVSLQHSKRFDVLHAHMFGSNVWGTLLGRACGVPVVLAHEHSWSYTDERFRAWIDGHLIGRLATRFLAVSAADRERMIALEGVPASKALVMPSAHVPHRAQTTLDIRTELGLDAATPLVFTAAVLRPEKRLDVLLEAHRELLDHVPAAHLVIAGHGPCERQLERLIDHLGLGARAHLLGVRHDVDAILPQADVAAISSDREGIPLFMLESLVAGTPLVATAVGGIPEVIEHGRSGLLVAPRDPAMLAAALARVLTDSDSRSRLARAASVRGQAFAIQSAANAYADLYEQLLAESNA